MSGAAEILATLMPTVTKLTPEIVEFLKQRLKGQKQLDVTTILTMASLEGHARMEQYLLTIQGQMMKHDKEAETRFQKTSKVLLEMKEKIERRDMGV